ncbi:hypothetical protein ACXYMX_15965 [Sporosarcina sp. CAU 1771]
MDSKSTRMSNTLQYLVYIFAGITLTVILLFLEFQMWLVYLIIIGLSLLIFTVRPMYVIYRSKSLPAIDRYVIKNKKKPLFGYAYAQAYGDDEDIENALHRILEKHKQAEIQIIYGANLALHQKDADAVLNFANQMKRKDYKEYYLGTAYLMKEDVYQATTYLDQLSTAWMIHSLKASIAIHQNNLEAFKKEAQLSEDSAAGVQMYSIHHMMKRMEQNAF